MCPGRILVSGSIGDETSNQGDCRELLSGGNAGSVTMVERLTGGSLPKEKPGRRTGQSTEKLEPGHGD